MLSSLRGIWTLCERKVLKDGSPEIFHQEVLKVRIGANVPTKSSYLQDGVLVGVVSSSGSAVGAMTS